MKTVVHCQCGSTFNAPASLVGQVVKCPVCGQAMRVPEPPAQPASPNQPQPTPGAGPQFDSPGGSTAFGSSAGPSASQRSSMAGSSTGQRSAITDSPKSRTELCPRCQAVHVEPGRLCTSCLYEMHTGLRSTRRNRWKFSAGVIASAAVVLIAVGIGALILFNSSPTPPPQPDPRHAETDGQTPAGAASPQGGTASAGESSGEPSPPRLSNGPWAPAAAGDTRYDAVRHTQVAAQWDPETGAHLFTIRLRPARDGGGLNMGTRITLYRAAAAAGPFLPVDRITPSEIDPDSGALVFRLSDSEVVDAGHNRVHYRLSGMDDRGKRLFDTPAADFPVIPPPRIEGDRLVWQPAGDSADALPPLRCAVTVAADGWDHMALARIDLSGPVDQPLPSGVSNLPIRATLTIPAPTGIDMASGGSGTWRRAAQSHSIDTATGTQASSLAGIVPRWTGDGLGYELLPDGEAFTTIRESTSDEGSLRLTLAAADGSEHRFDLPDAPAATRLSATPYDRAIHLSWDGESLRSGSDRFDEPVQWAVLRSEDGSEPRVLATLSTDQTRYTDSEIQPGVTYTYQVRITSAADAQLPALMRTRAWLVGHGEVPVLAPVTPTATIPGVAAEPGLTRLNLSLARPQLCYPDTDLPALAIMEAIRKSVTDAGATLIERGLLQRAMGEARVGSPAQAQLTVVDAAWADGPAIELWLTDLVTGNRQRIAAASAGSADPAAFARVVENEVARRLAPQVGDPSAAEATDDRQRIAPRDIQLAPILPIDQIQPYHGHTALSRQLLEHARLSGTTPPVLPMLPPAAGPETGGQFRDFGTFGQSEQDQAPSVMVTGRVWNNESRKVALRLLAVHSDTGELVAVFDESQVDEKTPERFVEWCRSLRLASGGSPADADTSSLMRHELGLPPIHRVWRAMAGESANDRSMPHRSMRPTALPPIQREIVTLSLGLPLPTGLRPFDAPTMRSTDDPLCSVRPWVAFTAPPTFDGWTTDYAAYVQADYEAFHHGLSEAAAAMRQANGRLRPNLIVRGQTRFSGSMIFTQPIRPSENPVVLNQRGYLPLGDSSQPTVHYRQALDQHFQERPWAAYHAWKQVPDQLAEPFLRGVVLGVQNDRYGSVDLSFSLPPSLHRFLAAALLDELNSGVGAAFRRRAIDVSERALQDLIEHNPEQLSPRQSMYVSRALLILAFDQNSAVMPLLQDPRRLIRYVQVEPDQAPDVLRMLVDRVGTNAWHWGAQRPDLNWNAFLWRSQRELQMVADALPEVLPDALRQYLEQQRLASR